MKATEISIGTRGSSLALAQANLVAKAFAEAGLASRIVLIETAGDRRAPDTAWGEGAFVAAIERALLDGRVDVAVHSAKDIPTDEDRRLVIGAYLERADPRDALVVRSGAEAQTIEDLPTGSRVGTDSPRRTGFLLALRPDLVLHPLHGNVDTRLRRLDSGETDALVLACAGLDRLGLGGRIAQRLAPLSVPPAPGQGAIAIQIRRDDPRMTSLASAIDHGPTRAAVEAERAFLAASGGGCRSPIGALAEVDDGELILLGGHARPDGTSTAVGRRSGSVDGGIALARELGRDLARQLYEETAPGIRSARATRPRVIVTRSNGQAGELAASLETAGIEPVLVPAIAVELEPPGSDLDRFARQLRTYLWVVITSPNGARAILAAAARVLAPPESPRWAAIGPATRRVLENDGIEIDFQPTLNRASSLGAELPIRADDSVLVIRGDLADDGLAARLRTRGAAVDDVVAYRTREAPESSRALLRTALAEGPIGAIVFTSGSTVRGLSELARVEGIDVASIPCVCIGPETAEAARTAGFRVLAVSPSRESAAIAATTARAIATKQQESS